MLLFVINIASVLKRQKNSTKTEIYFLLSINNEDN